MTSTRIAQVWLRNYIQFRYTLLVTLFWILLEPLLYLLAIGYGLGSYIPGIEGQSYMGFYFPALLANTVMMIPFFECTYNNYSKLTWQKTYSTMLLTPLNVSELLWGEMLWGATKGLLSALGVAVIARALGVFEGWAIWPSFVVLFLVAFLFSCLGMLFTTLAQNYDSFIYASSGLIIPMSLFSGTYFPMSQMPFGVRWAIEVLPLAHAVRAVRTCLDGNINWGFALDLGILVLYSVILFMWTLSRLERKLVV